jgi:hypothetical protein
MLGVGNRVNSTIEILAQRTLWMRSGRRGELRAFHRAMVLQRPPRNLCVHCAKLRIADVIPLSCRPSPRPEPVAFARLQGIHFSQGPALPSGRSIVSISGKVLVFGAAYSVYVRAVRLALEEKSVPYELINVDIFAAGGPPAILPVTRSDASPPSNTTGFVCTRLLRSSATSTRLLTVHFCNRRIQRRAPE